jgi:hypothetical protein
MFSRVWSSARFKQWRTTMISIEDLLEDEQDLSMGEMLTVNFRQPSHEFTFGVGMSFISYTLVLTPWYNKFVCACRFWSLVFMQDFSDESKTFGISSLSTSWQDLEARFKSSNEVNMTPRSPRTRPEKMKNSRDPDRKCRILRDKELHLNRRETSVKGPHAAGGIL